VSQCFLDEFSRLAVQHRDGLLARVQIATDNPHLGLLRPERCDGGHRTVYAGRREADVVIASYWRRGCSRSEVEVLEGDSWLGGRDSNPDTVVQSHVSYRWTTSHYSQKRVEAWNL
jgi:hypothetical protein